MRHITEEQLVAYAMGDVEAGTDAATRSHVESCPLCRTALDQIRATLDAAATLPVPDRGDDYGARVWDRIESRLVEPRSIESTHNESGFIESSHSSTSARQHRTSAQRHSSTSARHFTRLAPWLAAAATVAMVGGAYWLGRQNAIPSAPQSAQAPATPSPGTEAIRERVVLAALGEHFDRTERTLVELVNSQPSGHVDISAEQAWARDLLDANRLYRQAAGRSSPALSQVLDDLEPVLLEIANSPSQLTSDEFKTLRDRIEGRSLVFKVRVTGADVRARQRALISRGESQS